jgi:hypothetical protein
MVRWRLNGGTNWGVRSPLQETTPYDRRQQTVVRLITTRFRISRWQPCAFHRDTHNNIVGTQYHTTAGQQHRENGKEFLRSCFWSEVTSVHSSDTLDVSTKYDKSILEAWIQWYVEIDIILHTYNIKSSFCALSLLSRSYIQPCSAVQYDSSAPSWLPEVCLPLLFAYLSYCN